MTDWPAIIEDLRRCGLRYIDVGAEIDKLECWVSRLARGETKKVDYDLGCEIMRLHARETAKLQVKVERIT